MAGPTVPGPQTTPKTAILKFASLTALGGLGLLGVGVRPRVGEEDSLEAESVITLGQKMAGKRVQGRLQISRTATLRLVQQLHLDNIYSYVPLDISPVNRARCPAFKTSSNVTAQRTVTTEVTKLLRMPDVQILLNVWQRPALEPTLSR